MEDGVKRFRSKRRIQRVRAPFIIELTGVDDYFLSLDLSKPFNISSPPIKGLDISGQPPLDPPAVSQGALWPSSDGKYLYQFGGESSNNSVTLPSTELVWKYTIKNQSWSSVTPKGDSIQRPAEGASCAIPMGRGMGVYVGGVLDAYTVPEWSKPTPPKYLSSMIAFDMVGFLVLERIRLMDIGNRVIYEPFIIIIVVKVNSSSQSKRRSRLCSFHLQQQLHHQHHQRHPHFLGRRHK